jgi:hypothetical protein
MRRSAILVLAAILQAGCLAEVEEEGGEQVLVWLR